MVVTPTFIQRPAHPNNYSRGRVGGRNGQLTFHHVVGTAESAAQTFANSARQASAHYTVTDVPGIIFQHVGLEDTAWADGNSASNSRAITVEHHGDWSSGYHDETVINNSALLIAWLIANGLVDHWCRHRDVSLIATACCADLPIEEIWPPPRPPITWTRFPTARTYRLNKATSMWRFDAATWGAVRSVKKFAAGQTIEIAGQGYNPNLNATYLVSAFSFEKMIPNGFNAVDMDIVAGVLRESTGITWTELPTPVEYVLNNDAALEDFNHTSDNDTTTRVTLNEGDRFTAVAHCENFLLGSTYAVPEYSYLSRSTMGVNIADLDVYVPPKIQAADTAEWRRNLKGITTQKLTVLGRQTPLVNLETGAVVKQVGGGTVIDIVKTTTFEGVEYLISSCSASVGAASGLKRSDLGIPITPPSKEKPAWLERWEDITDQDMYARADTNLYNLVDSSVVTIIKRGQKIYVASTTEIFGQRYALIGNSANPMEGRGIRLDDLDVEPVPDEGPQPAPEQPPLN